MLQPDEGMGTQCVTHAHSRVAIAHPVLSLTCADVPVLGRSMGHRAHQLPAWLGRGRHLQLDISTGRSTHKQSDSWRGDLVQDLLAVSEMGKEKVELRVLDKVPLVGMSKSRNTSLFCNFCWKNT